MPLDQLLESRKRTARLLLLSPSMFDKMDRFEISYRDDSDTGCPVFTSVWRGYDAAHAQERFHDSIDGEGWEIIGVKRLELSPVTWHASASLHVDGDVTEAADYET